MRIGQGMTFPQNLGPFVLWVHFFSGFEPGQVYVLILGEIKNLNILTKTNSQNLNILKENSCFCYSCLKRHLWQSELSAFLEQYVECTYSITKL